MCSVEKRRAPRLHASFLGPPSEPSLTPVESLEPRHVAVVYGDGDDYDDDDDDDDG